MSTSIGLKHGLRIGALVEEKLTPHTQRSQVLLQCSRPSRALTATHPNWVSKPQNPRPRSSLPRDDVSPSIVNGVHR